MFGNLLFRFCIPGEDDSNPPTWQTANDEYTAKLSSRYSICNPRKRVWEEWCSDRGMHRLQQDLDKRAHTVDAEDAEARKALEEKLRELEASIAQEREEARMAMENQRQAFEHGGNVSWIMQLCTQLS